MAGYRREAADRGEKWQIIMLLHEHMFLACSQPHIMFSWWHLTDIHARGHWSMLGGLE